MTQYGFYFDGTRCTGCKTCELACKDYKDLDLGIAYRKVYECSGGSWVANSDGTYEPNVFAYYVSMACNHCSTPVCAKVCPTGAMHKDENGIVSVDTKKCVGCGYCELACPYNAPKVDPEKGQSVKCNGCLERIAIGEAPVCVEACPARALQFGDITSLSGKGKIAAIAPLPDPSYTGPNFAINPSADARSYDSTEGFLENPLEV